MTIGARSLHRVLRLIVLCVTFMVVRPSAPPASALDVAVVVVESTSKTAALAVTTRRAVTTSAIELASTAELANVEPCAPAARRSDSVVAIATYLRHCSLLC